MEDILRKVGRPELISLDMAGKLADLVEVCGGNVLHAMQVLHGFGGNLKLYAEARRKLGIDGKFECSLPTLTKAVKAEFARRGLETRKPGRPKLGAKQERDAALKLWVSAGPKQIVA